MTQAAINTQLPVTFYDDRNKFDFDLYLTRVLFENETVVLGEAKPLLFDREGRLKNSAETELVLFNKADGTVLVEAFNSWYAKNPENTTVPIAAR